MGVTLGPFVYAIDNVAPFALITATPQVTTLWLQRAVVTPAMVAAKRVFHESNNKEVQKI